MLVIFWLCAVLASQHTLQVPRVYIDRYSFIDNEYRRLYHAMVACLDDIVGNLTQAFHQSGIWDNLLWVTASDNGGPLYVGGGEGRAQCNATRLESMHPSVCLLTLLFSPFLFKTKTVKVEISKISRNWVEGCY